MIGVAEVAFVEMAGIECGNNERRMVVERPEDNLVRREPL
jgi:hypothetical protein